MQSLELIDIIASSLTEVIWRAPGGDALGTVIKYNTQQNMACFVPNDPQWGLQRWVKWSELDLLPGLYGVIRGRSGFKCGTPDCNRTFAYILTMDAGEENEQAYRCSKHGDPMTEQAISYTLVVWDHLICTGNRGTFRTVQVNLTADEVDTIRDLYVQHHPQAKEGTTFKFVPSFE